MDFHLDKEAEQQIDQCLSLLKNVLGKDLLGAYLYGSSIVGGLQKFSDIDLFVVSDRPTTSEEKAKLATEMLSISGVYLKSTKRPIEMIIVVKSEVNPWHYLPAFDFQYGDWMRKDFENGNFEPWPTKVMPDIAVLITQVLLASNTLLGPNPNQLLDPVPYRDFITASVKELDNLIKGLGPDTRNVLLTFARIWCVIETDTISSKPDAATWVIDRLPSEYKPVMQRARAICIGEEQEHWDDIKALIQPCADFMVSRIKEQTVLLESLDSINKSIRLSG